MVLAPDDMVALARKFAKDGKDKSQVCARPKTFQESANWRTVPDSKQFLDFLNHINHTDDWTAIGEVVGKSVTNKWQFTKNPMMDNNVLERCRGAKCKPCSVPVADAKAKRQRRTEDLEAAWRDAAAAAASMQAPDAPSSPGKAQDNGSARSLAEEWATAP